MIHRLREALAEKKQREELEERIAKVEQIEKKEKNGKRGRKAKGTAEAEKGAEKSVEEFKEEEYKIGVLSGVDLSKSLSEKEYKTRLDKLQKKVEILHSELYRQRIPVILAFEGWDAAGKGGAIRRLTSKLDPRGYAVCPTSAANDIERKHHYLGGFGIRCQRQGILRYLTELGMDE